MKDKVVVVTGGARGIGAALAHRAGAEKPRGVVVADIDLPQAELVAQSLRDESVPALAAHADVTNREDVERLVGQTEEAFGAIDVLFSNAGVASGAGLHAATSVWSHSWQVNVLSHVYLAQTVIPGMARRRAGQIVITASAAGLLGIPGDAPYAITKSATVAFAEWLAMTYRPRGVTVRALCPLGVRTELLMPGLQSGHPAALAVAESAEILEPADVADAAVKSLTRRGFFIFPHAEVAALHVAKAADMDGWLEQRNISRTRS